MRLKNIVVIAALPLFLAACSDSDSPLLSTVSFSVSDAPVDSAEEVVIAFDKLEFIQENGANILVDVDNDQTGNDYQQIDLLDFPGSDSALILTNRILPTGNYKNLIIHIQPEQSLNFVVDNNGKSNLKQPSNKLKLGGFTIKNEAVQSFTIEFDLRQALVLRGNSNNNNGYNLKPHGVSIIDNSDAVSLSGTVDLNLLNVGTCINDTGNFVYLYENHALDVTKLADNFDPSDTDFDDSGLSASGFIAPYASTGINLTNGQYQFGFLPAGDYTVAFSCSAVADDPVQFNGLTIPDPIAQKAEIKLSATQESIHDFNE
jgi:hypothetical protein